MTHSRLIPLIITNYETNVSLLVLHELDIARLYFSTNILISKADGSETGQSIDHGNSVHKHAWLTLFKTMRRLKNISFSGKYQ